MTDRDAPLLRRAWRRIRPRTVDDPVFWLRIALVFVAQFAFVRGWRYTIEKEPVPMAIQLITEGFSVSGYGVLWFFAAAAALGSIPKAWPGGSAPAIVISLVFAFGFTLSWLASYPVLWDSPESPLPGGPGRADYTSASTYWLAVGLLTCGYFLSRKALRAPSGP